MVEELEGPGAGAGASLTEAIATDTEAAATTTRTAQEIFFISMARSRTLGKVRTRFGIIQRLDRYEEKRCLVSSPEEQCGVNRFI